MNRALRLAELVTLYAGLPILLGLIDAPRRLYYSVLLIAALGVLLVLRRAPDFSWRSLWHGRPWPAAARRAAFWRFCLNVPLLAMLTLAVAPDRLFSFPAERPALWALVMLLYPILSVVPQVLVFRAFYMTRYGALFGTAPRIVIGGLLFGVAHAMYGNWVAPLCTALGGILLLYSFEQHRSLKWAVVEHAAYGNLIFTLGLGLYFFKSS